MVLKYEKDSQGNIVMVYNGYTYVKQKQYKQSKKYTKWICVAKHKNCKGSLLTSLSKKSPELVSEHNHPSHSRAGEDQTTLSSVANSDTCTEPEYIPSSVSQEEISNIDSSADNNYTLKTRSQSHQQQPSNKQINKMKSDTFPVTAIMSQEFQPHKRALASNSLPSNKSGKELHASAVRLQFLHPQSSSGSECTEWYKYLQNLKTPFPRLLTDEHNVDIILASEGQSIKCHKVVLTSRSVYFEKLLNEIVANCHFPAVVFTDWRFWQMKAVIEYLYQGKVTVRDEKLPAFLSLSETLQIKGFQSPTEQTRLLSKNTCTDKQNSRHNLVRRNYNKNTVPEQTEINRIPIERQKRKQDLIESEDYMKTEGINPMFADIILFHNRYYCDPIVLD